MVEVDYLVDIVVHAGCLSMHLAQGRQAQGESLNDQLLATIGIAMSAASVVHIQ